MACWQGPGSRRGVFQKQVGAPWHLRGDRMSRRVTALNEVGTHMQLRSDFNSLHVVTAGSGVCDRWIVKTVGVPGYVLM